MTRECRYIRDKGGPASRFAAVSIAMARATVEGAPMTLAEVPIIEDEMGLQYFNHPYKDIDLEACKELGISIVRNPQTGGPIFAAKGLLLKTFSFPKEEIPELVAPGDFYKLYFPVLAEALSKKYDIVARFKPVQDIDMVNKEDGLARKASMAGTGADPTGKVFYFQFGLNAPEPPYLREVMEKIIPFIPEKGADKAAEVATPVARVTNLSRETGRLIPAEEANAIETETLCKVFDLKLIHGDYTEKESKSIEEAVKFLHSEDWILERSEKKWGEIPPDVEFVEHRFKIPVPGAPFMRISLLRKGDTIYDILLTGTIHAGPTTMGPPYTSLINEIERRLKGIKIDEKLLREKVQEAYNLPGRYIENCTVDEMAKAIMGACGKPAQDIADAYRRTI